MLMPPPSRESTALRLLLLGHRMADVQEATGLSEHNVKGLRKSLGLAKPLPARRDATLDPIMRHLFSATDWSDRRIARELGVSSTAVRLRRVEHLAQAPDNRKMTPRRKASAIGPEKIAEIERRVALGEAPSTIANALGVGKSTAGFYAKEWRTRNNITPGSTDATAAQIEGLKQWLLTDDSRSLAEVARGLGVSVPTASLHAASLEEELGVPSKRSSRAVTADQISLIENMAAAGKRNFEIMRVVKLRPGTVWEVIAAWKRRNNIPLKPVRPPLTKQEVASIRAEMERGETTSIADLARVLSLNPITITPRVRKFREELIASGRNRQCACGRPAYHSKACSARASARRGGAVVSLDTVERVRRLLLANLTKEQIMRREGLTVGQVALIMKTHLTPAEKEARQAVTRSRAALLRGKIERVGSDILARRDTLFNRISDLVPRGIDPALRDDAISEAYVAVLEGEVEEEHLAANVKKFVNAAYRDYASKWGPLSLDMAMSEDDERSHIEMIEDETALDAFDSIKFPKENDDGRM